MRERHSEMYDTKKNTCSLHMNHGTRTGLVHHLMKLGIGFAFTCTVSCKNTVQKHNEWVGLQHNGYNKHLKWPLFVLMTSFLFGFKYSTIFLPFHLVWEGFGFKS